MKRAPSVLGFVASMLFVAIPPERNGVLLANFVRLFVQQMPSQLKLNLEPTEVEEPLDMISI